MKARSDSKVIRVLKDIHEYLLTRGIKPEYMRLGNESSPPFQRYLKAKDIDFRLSPPGMHIRNASERAINTLKDHFIAGVCSTDPESSIQNWDRLLELA